MLSRDVHPKLVGVLAEAMAAVVGAAPAGVDNTDRFLIGTGRLRLHVSTVVGRDTVSLSANPP